MQDWQQRLLDGPAGAAWRYFFEISDIPRPSYHEERVVAWLKKIAEQYGWHWQQDETGNVLMKVPGRGVLANHSPVIIQGHMDMVCEQSELSTHDFMTDPLQLREVDGWVTATETTLGADNGIAVAMALAVAADEQLTDRVPLELLMTMAEETGLYGAARLEQGFVSGELLLNLDSEEFGVFTIGCAGGQSAVLSWPLSEVPEQSVVRGCLKGFRGGHSGVDIHRRENALFETAKFLHSIPGVVLHEIEAGSKTNAIPRECHFAVSGVTEAVLLEAVESWLPVWHEQEVPAVKLVLDAGVSRQGALPGVLEFLATLPNGILAMETDFEGIVKTSSSMTVIKPKAGILELTVNARSSQGADCQEVMGVVAERGEAHGATVKLADGYVGWQPRKGSLILNKGIEIFKGIFNFEPEISAIHAGLECGVIGDRLGIDEMLSFGPDILYPHSPDEKLNIESFDKTYRLLETLVTTTLDPA